MKKRLLIVLLAVAVAAVAGISTTSVSAQPVSQTFSVAVHIEYPDGFVYDGVFARGVEASDLATFMAACGKGHRGGSGVRYHCYPIAE